MASRPTYKRDMWAIQREQRLEASTYLIIDEAAKHWHRICPTCEGERMVCVFAGSRIDPPDFDDCPTCEGVGRVDQERWQEGQDMLEAQRAYEDALAEAAWEADDEMRRHW